MRSSRLLVLIALALALTAIEIHAVGRPLFLGGRGQTILLAYGNSIYKPTGDDKMEKLFNIARPQITAMTVGPDGVFTAVGRNLYGGALDGKDMRLMGSVPAEAVTLLANASGVLWSAGGDSLYSGPVAGGTAPFLVMRLPGSISALYAAADGLYASTGKILWKIDGTQRTRVADAPAPIVGLTGGDGRLCYAYPTGGDIAIATVGAKEGVTIPGLARIQSLYLDSASRTLHYSWSDDRGPHYRSVPLP